MNADNLSFILTIATTDQHFEEILSLQNQNHYSKISKHQQQNDGFLFAMHSLPFLKKMAALVPQVIALSEDRVVGYNLAMISPMNNELPSIVPMFEQLTKWSYKGKPLTDYRVIVGGQVCVDKDFRGRGMISQLYHRTKELTSGSYDMCFTEIAVRNTVSLNAHRRIGFEVLGAYNDGQENWNLVLWDWTER